MVEKFTTPNGETFEELNPATGTYKVTDLDGRLVRYTHAERVAYMPSLAEQYFASRDTVPRLPKLEIAP